MMTFFDTPGKIPPAMPIPHRIQLAPAHAGKKNYPRLLPKKRPLNAKDKKIAELESLIQTISVGKYMWESTFDAITNPVMIVSPDYKILRANRAAARASKVDVRKITGTICYQTLAGSDKPCQGCPLPSTLRTRSSHVSSLEPFKKSGHHYQVNAYPIIPAQEGEEVVLHYRDVTEEKELQRQLMHSEKMAAIGMLAGGIAHEINNPLGGILAFAQLAMRDLPAVHEAQGDLKEIEEAALRCKRIVQDLLDFSRQNRDEVMIEVNLNDAIQKIVPLIQVQARTSQIDNIIDLAPGLPQIRGSAHKLQQVFLNLAANAYQAMTHGGVLTIRTFLDQQKNRVCALISDNGPGIPNDHMDKIFDPYFTTKDQGKGTGLGLSITYGIVQEHQGKIEVENKKEGGTQFLISFPLA